MSAECSLYRVVDNVIRAEVPLGGNHTACEIRQFAADHDIEDHAPSEEVGYQVYPFSPVQAAEYLAMEPTFYEEPERRMQWFKDQLKLPGQLQFVISF